MRRIDRSVLYMNNDRYNRPSATVASGETFVVVTELATGDWLHSMEDVWSPDKTKGANPCVCIAVEGAMPGDALAVTIEQIVPSTLGYMAIETDESIFPAISKPIFGDIFAHTVSIREGAIQLLPGIDVPVQPMIGTLGTTLGDKIETHIAGGFYGGNMDIQEVAPGATVYLPVLVEGAMLNVGDVHARQSDGEASAVEVRSEVTMTVRVEKRSKPLAGPRIVNDDYIMTAACSRLEKEAYEIAFRDMLEWLVDEHGYSERHAYILLGATVEGRCTRYIAPSYTFVCKLNRGYLSR
ncbi:acetamidase/formamidase family protein [Paenibacillus chungangensis]|uniref:Acetamidase/formamidase family protein n=1 Tax=Paenibacillus chungangensis TaxID=696535 RepID=A0ABW3HTB6_9BACL